MKSDNWGLKGSNKGHICVLLLEYMVMSYAVTKSHVSVNELVTDAIFVNVHGKCTTKNEKI